MFFYNAMQKTRDFDKKDFKIYEILIIIPALD